MRRSAVILAFIMLISAMASAQAYESTIQFDKKKQASVAIEYSYPPEAVENAIIQKMERLGYKAKEEKGFLNKDRGFLVFRNAYITDISKDRMDYVVKVDRKSRREKDEAELNLVMMKNDENAMGRLSAFDIGKAKAFLNDMIPDIEAAYLEIQINDQEEAITKAEKRLKGLQDDKLDLDKKFAENLKAQDETVKDIDTKKKDLETLKGKRKKG